MLLLPPAALSIVPVQRRPDELPCSEIVLYGIRSGQVVDGAILEAALSWKDCFLVFLTDDIPGEDTLRIYFLDADLRVIDSARLGAMYATGAFRGLQLVGPDEVSFRYFDEVQWVLRVLEQPAFALPMVPDPPGVWRPVRFFRRFDVKRGA